MQRKLAVASIASILEALSIKREATLLALASEDGATAEEPSPCHSPRPHSTSLPPAVMSAELLCNDVVQQSVLEAVTLQTRPVPGQPVAAKAEIGSALEGRRLCGLSLDGARLTSSFNRSDLTESSWRRTYVVYTTFNLSCLHQACLRDAQFHSCTFIGVDAVRVDARGGRFSHCVFRQADLRLWNVCGAIFFGCTFTLSDLTGWTFDGQTTVLEPVDWGRCRRLDWTAGPGSTCGSVFVPGHHVQALSLPPARVPPWSVDV